MSSLPSYEVANGQLSILVVDDTPENLTLFGELLKPHYHVRVTNSGSRALQLANSERRPDLILLDVLMPEMTGYQVIEKLQENNETRDIPVIFVSALDEDEDETHGLELGAVDYITKPVRPAIALARIQAQLELKASRDRIKNQNVWLEMEVQRRMQENEEMQDIIFLALANLAETRDNETGNHILRTQGYIAVLCDELAKLPKYAQQLNSSEIAKIVKSAPLHDIGKVGIPDQILLKPGKLTEDEWIIMRTHASLGAEAICRAIGENTSPNIKKFLQIAIDIAGCHHEKWDGSGYPNALKGEEIPLSARLMALADVFDALMSRRVYKSAFSWDETCDIIIKDKAKHFDPELVDAFITRKQEFLGIANRYKDLPE